MISALRQNLTRRAERRRAARDSHQQHEIVCSSLCCARHGQCARILAFADDCAHCDAARLREMGLREGATVRVLRDGDPLMVCVENARFGIARSVAMRVYCDLLD
jgi:Fe2+ transport system protein FeoA